MRGGSSTPSAVSSHDRALRRAVLRLKDCLGHVPAGERRVLRLRAGLGTKHTRSRTEVARMTHLPRSRVAALERKGLRRLRALARAGACGGSSSANSQAPSGVTPGHARDPLAQRPAAVGVLGQRASSQGSPAQRPPADSSSDSDHDRPFLRAPDDALDLAPLAIALALGAFVYLAIREARRST